MTEQIKSKERAAESDENKEKSEFYKMGVLVFTQKIPVLKDRPITCEDTEMSKK